MGEAKRWQKPTQQFQAPRQPSTRPMTPRLLVQAIPTSSSRCDSSGTSRPCTPWLATQLPGHFPPEIKAERMELLQLYLANISGVAGSQAVLARLPLSAGCPNKSLKAHHVFHRLDLSCQLTPAVSGNCQLKLLMLVCPRMKCTT